MTAIGILDPTGKNTNPLNNKPYSDTYIKLAQQWSKFPAYENVNNTFPFLKYAQLNPFIKNVYNNPRILLIFKSFLY